jgi:hypothetical protein
MYGLIALTPELEEQRAGRRVVFAGCTVTDDDPDFACTACGIGVHDDGRIMPGRFAAEH